MHTSVFTPTHNPKYMLDAYASLQTQTHENWDWVILANKGARIPAEIGNDKRVTVYHEPSGLGGIGYLKQYACSKCTGDLLVELDHDDLLAPTALERIAAQAKSTGAGFLFSDWIEFIRAGETATMYRADHGWEQYPATYAGEAYRAYSGFDISPASLHTILYAPNHVRVWRKDTYIETGGHDPSLAICDDHDLVCRTYLTGCGFEHIKEPLYLQRILQDGMERNSHVSSNKLATQRMETSKKYTMPIVHEWCRRNNLGMIDIGGFHNSPRKYISVDMRDGADVVCDVRNGLPFPTGSVGCIRAADFLEHLAPGDEIVNFWNECYRVLAPGGWFHSMTPSESGDGAAMDPTHKSRWNLKSHWYVTREGSQKFVDKLTAKFAEARAYTLYPTAWHGQNNIPYVSLDLIALKGQRHPGLVMI